MALDKITGLEMDDKNPPQRDKITGLPMRDPEGPPVRREWRDAALNPYSYVGGPGGSFTQDELNTLPMGTQMLGRDDAFEARALSQGTWEKWKHGLLKAGVTFGGAFTENTLGVAAGLISVLTGGSFSDTALGKTIDGWNEWAQKSFPNYRTREEEEKRGTLAGMWGANFFADSVMNGFAYTAASIASVMVPAGPVLNISRVLRMARAAQNTSKMKTVVNNLAKSSKIGKPIDDIAAEVVDSPNIWSNIKKGALDAVTRTETILGSAMAEANVEARESKNTFLEEYGNRLLEKKRNEYLENNPDATPLELSKIGLSNEEINDLLKNANYVQNMNFATNAVIVGGTNMLTFGRLMLGRHVDDLAKMKKLHTQTKVDIDGKIIDNRSKLRKLYQKVQGDEPLKGWEKIYIGTLRDSMSEAFQEGMQFVSGTAYVDYFGGKMMGGDVHGMGDLMEAFGDAFTELVNSPEGRESMQIGFLIGGGTSTVRSLGERLLGMKDKPTPMEEYLKVANDPDIVGSNLNIRNLNIKELSFLELEAFKAHKAAVESGDVLGAARAYTVMMDAKVVKAVQSGAFEPLLENVKDLHNMTIEEYGKFLGIDPENITEESKQEAIDGMISDLTEKKNLYENIRKHYARNPITPAITGRIIKKIAPNFFRAEQINDMRRQMAMEHMYVTVSNKRFIKKMYEDLNTELKEFAEMWGMDLMEDQATTVSTDFVSGNVWDKASVESYRKKVEKKKEEERKKNKKFTEEDQTDAVKEDFSAINEHLSKWEAFFNYLEKSEDLKKVVERWKENPTMKENILRQINHLTGQKKDDFTVEEVMDIFAKIEEVTENSKQNPEEVTEFEKLMGKYMTLVGDAAFTQGILQLGGIASKMLQLGIMEAELEFNHSYLNTEEQQESLMSEYIRIKEARLMQSIEEFSGELNINALRGLYGANAEQGADNFLIQDYDVEEPSDPLQKRQWFKNAISHYEEQDKLVDDLKKGILKTKYKKYIKSVLEDLKKRQKENEDLLAQNQKDGKSKSIVRNAFHFMQVYLFSDEVTQNMERAVAMTKGLSDKEIMERMSIRILDVEEGKLASPTSQGAITTIPGFNGDGTKGVYVFFDDMMVGGLVDPEYIQINGESVNTSNLYHLRLLNQDFVKMENGKPIGRSVEGEKFVSALATMRNLFLPLREGETTVISGETLSKELDPKINFFNQSFKEEPFESRPTTAEFFAEKFDTFKYSFVEGMDEGIIGVMHIGDKVEYYFFDGNEWSLIEDENTIVNIEKKEQKIPNNWNRSSYIILPAGDSYVKAILDYPLPTEERKQEVFDTLVSKLTHLVELQKQGADVYKSAVAKMSNEERDLLNLENHPRTFFSAKRSEGFLSGDVYFHLFVEKEGYKDNPPRIKLLVKQKDTLASVTIVFNVVNGVLVGSYADVETGDIIIKDMESLVTFLNGRLKEGAENAQTEEKSMFLSQVAIEGIKQDVKGEFESAKMSVTPTAKINFSPKYKNYTNGLKEYYKGRSEKIKASKEIVKEMRRLRALINQVEALNNSFTETDANHIMPLLLKEDPVHLGNTLYKDVEEIRKLLKDLMSKHLEEALTDAEYFIDFVKFVDSFDNTEFKQPSGPSQEERRASGEAIKAQNKRAREEAMEEDELEVDSKEEETSEIQEEETSEAQEVEETQEEETLETQEEEEPQEIDDIKTFLMDIKIPKDKVDQLTEEQLQQLDTSKSEVEIMKDIMNLTTEAPQNSNITPKTNQEMGVSETDVNRQIELIKEKLELDTQISEEDKSKILKVLNTKNQKTIGSLFERFCKKQ